MMSPLPVGRVKSDNIARYKHSGSRWSCRMIWRKEKPTTKGGIAVRCPAWANWCGYCEGVRSGQKNRLR